MNPSHPTPTPARGPWHDRFGAPTWEALRQGSPAEAAVMMDQLRGRFVQMGMLDRVEWRGVWKWTLVFAQGDRGRHRAYIVPDPARPRVTLPISKAAVDGLATKKLPRHIREALLHAPTVDGVRWATWDLAGATLVEDLAGLLAATMPAAEGVGVPCLSDRA